MNHSRLVGLDVFRGWAILLMILFHLSYDLNYFHFIDIDLKKDLFWVYARFIIVTMFLFSVGVSLALVHTPKIRWKKIYKRTLILGLASLLVSLATYIQFPTRWVYFGVLHFILFSSWLGLLFLPYPRFSFLLGIFILIGSYFKVLHTHHLFNFLQTPLHLPRYTEDLVVFFPWFAVILFGISFVGLGFHTKLFTLPIFTTQHPLNRLLTFCGRHALIIYLLHQPLLFAFLMFLTR